MSKIPLDIITDIFKQLPVKSLLRFTTLSKTLFSLIHVPDFIQLHLHHSLQTKSNFSLILKDWNLYRVDLDSLTAAEHVIHPMPPGTEAVGSINGLVALRNSERDLAIYNMSTRKIKRLPVAEIRPPIDCLRTGYVFYGFGFDRVNDDYKLIRMAQFFNEEERGEASAFDLNVQVYSLRNDSWVMLKNLPDYLRRLHKSFYHVLHRRGYGVLVNGMLHWISPERPEMDLGNDVVGFNIAKEEFFKVPQPSYGDGGEGIQVDVGVLDGDLCVMRNYGHVRVDLWVMKEYGVKESWVKLLSLDKLKSISAFMFLTPLTYSRDGERVLLEVNDDRFIWYDIKRGSVKNVRINGAPKSFGSELYVGSRSLVPVDYGTESSSDGLEEEENEKRIANGMKRDDFLSVGFKLKL